MNNARYSACSENTATKKTCRWLITSALALTQSVAQAARPMITDDARLVDAKACQVETWLRSNQGSREYWALPACNFTGNLELTFGGSRLSDASGSSTSNIVVQGKTLFKTMEPNGWGIGLAVGAVRHPGEEKHVGELYSYVPVSFSLRNDQTFVHVNVGATHNTISSVTRGTAGIGLETALGERSWFIAESFKQQSGRLFYQAGVRYWLVSNRMQIDATYGNRLGSDTDERWFSIGLRLLSPAFLP